MSQWQLKELATATQARLLDVDASARVSAVGTDSRALRPDCLFVALRGDRFDGHDFVEQARQNGARAVMVDAKSAAQWGASQGPALVVDDTLRALGDMAHYVRRQKGHPVVGITGSNGKTTTKELAAAALQSLGGVHRTRGNFNNLVGLPLTLLAWPQDATLAVVEMGMNAPGEIARLSEIAEPDVGVITNIGAAHLQGLGSVEGVAKAKAELWAGLGDSATAVVNADDARSMDIALPLCRTRHRVLFGRADNADVRIVTAVQSTTGLALSLSFAGHVVATKLPLLGIHNAHNGAAAAAAAWALGATPDAIGEGLAGAKTPPGRLRLLPNMRVSHGTAAGTVIHVLDDTYNANPQSVRAALQAQGELAGSGRRIAVLGDMLELGPTAAAHHHQIGRSAVEHGVAWLLCLGDHAASMAEGARNAGGEAEAFATMEALLDTLEGILQPADWVLVKGSRGMRMERVVSRLSAEGGN